MNTQQYTITTNDSPATDGFHTVPAYTVGTGTISTDNTNNGYIVAGTTTTFLDEIKPLHWLANESEDYARQVTAVQSDTILYINAPFDADLAGDDVLIIPRLAPKRIVLFPRTGATGTIQGAVLTAGHTYEYEASDGTGINPIQIVVSAGVIEVTIDY